MDVRAAQTTIRLEVGDTSGVGAVRRAAMNIAETIGFDETERGEVGIVASEVASNIVKHAKRGEILMRELSRAGGQGSERGLEMLALDRGPGIADMKTAGRDGWSTAGSLGLGLGAIARLSTHSDMYTGRAGGLALIAQLWRESSTRAHGPRSDRDVFESGVVCIPLAGEVACGDAWSIKTQAARARVFVVDGLGHGPEAELAAQLALKTLAKLPELSPAAAMERVSAALRPTRGAAGLLIDIDAGRSTVSSCGVGNVAATILSEGAARQLVSHNGTLGHGTPRFQEFGYAWPAGGLLLVRTDGINTRWNLEAHPRLLSHHPGLMAGVVYRDFARGTDDVTVLALRAVKS